MTRVIAQGILLGLRESDERIRGPPALMVAIEDYGTEHLREVNGRPVEVYSEPDCPYDLNTDAIPKELNNLVRAGPSEELTSGPSSWIRKHIMGGVCMLVRYVHQYTGEEDYEFEIYGPPEQVKELKQRLCTLLGRYPFRVTEESSHNPSE